MSLSLKKGVSLPAPLAMAFAISCVHDTIREEGYDCVITSAIDGKHSRGSLHYVGLALDFRTNNMPSGELPRIRDKIAARLGENFDVVLEKDHLHVELDPKLAINS